jgi:hypothetical protein
MLQYQEKEGIWPEMGKHDSGATTPTPWQDKASDSREKEEHECGWDT